MKKFSSICLSFALLALSIGPDLAQTTSIPSTSTPPGPIISAQVTQANTSASGSMVSLSVRNFSVASHPATDLTITGTISGFGDFSSVLHFGAVDTHYTGTVSLNIPTGYTVNASSVVDGGTLTTDSTGSHLTYPVTNLDGQQAFVTMFDIGAFVGDPVLQPVTNPATPTPDSTSPTTNASPPSAPSSTASVSPSPEKTAKA